MDYSIMEEFLNNDTIRVNLEIPKTHLNRLNSYVKKNHITNRKKLLEMIVIKFSLENTEGEE